ncbi:MAG: AI-2E family transporter [Synergistetes bacterium]|nr:AI-2E family transporter [Synergistota bacterium]MCX8128172.1 AI-2E family transporter [Synergistota bacterium]MDW8192548.1 AI-2E family transporter [Synergistota bacterium]
MNKTLIRLFILYALLVMLLAFVFPFVFGTFLTAIAIVMILEPLSVFLSRKLRLSQAISNGVTLLLFFLSLTLLLIFLIPSLVRETATFYEMAARFFEKKEWEELLPPTLAVRLSQLFSLFEPRLLKLLESIISTVTRVTPQLLTFLFYVILGSVYLMYNFKQLRKGIPYLFPKSCRKEASLFLRDVYIQLRQYIFSISIVALFVGVSLGLLLWYLGSKYIILLSFWGFVTNYIPIVGVFLELIPLFLMTFSLGLKASIILGIGVFIIHISAFLIFLRLMGGYIRINPVAIIFLIMLFSSALDILGALIAVPCGIVFRVFWIRFLSPVLNLK